MSTPVSRIQIRQEHVQALREHVVHRRHPLAVRQRVAGGLDDAALHALGGLAEGRGARHGGEQRPGRWKSNTASSCLVGSPRELTLLWFAGILTADRLMSKLKHSRPSGPPGQGFMLAAADHSGPGQRLAASPAQNGSSLGVLVSCSPSLRDGLPVMVSEILIGRCPVIEPSAHSRSWRGEHPGKPLTSWWSRRLPHPLLLLHGVGSGPGSAVLSIRGLLKARPEGNPGHLSTCTPVCPSIWSGPWSFLWHGTVAVTLGWRSQRPRTLGADPHAQPARLAACVRAPAHDNEPSHRPSLLSSAAGRLARRRAA